MSGVHLVLPPSPQPSSSPPQTAIAFTAEWDLTENTFIFTPFDSLYPRSAMSHHFASSPIPVNVDEEPFPYSPALSSPSVYSQSMASPRHPGLPGIQTVWEDKKDVVEDVSFDSSRTPGSCNSSPCTPVSAIFDRESLYSHARNLSQSTTASSVTYVKDDYSPISPIVPSPRQAINALEKELELSAPLVNVRHHSAVGEYDEIVIMDRDLLLAPMDAFEQMLWDSTETESQVIQRKVSSRIAKQSCGSMHRTIPDVPRSAESNTSRFSSYSTQVSRTNQGDTTGLRY